LRRSEETSLVLEQLLRRLKREIPLGRHLNLVYRPDGGSKLSGEVVGDTIYIYEEDKEKAQETLIHEYLDYSLSMLIEPYRAFANLLVRHLNEEAYRKKEEVVEQFVKFYMRRMRTRTS
jgi:hypothetical protein